MAAPAGLRSWDLKIKAEFANLVSAPPGHSGQFGCTYQSLSVSVSCKEGVGGGTLNLVDNIGNVAWFESGSDKFREEAW